MFVSQRKNALAQLLGQSDAFCHFDASAWVLFAVVKKKTLGQKVIDFAVNAKLKFKNDEAKLAAVF